MDTLGVENMTATLPTVSLTQFDWLAYFEQNQQSWQEFDWDEVNLLTDSEKRLIARSIATFQLGESSEGSHLMKLARLQGNTTEILCLKAFIREEQRHARVLERFMQQANIPFLRRDWTDGIFRKLRRFANLEVAIAVLMTAEFIATLYYPALGRATRCPLLQKLCDRITQDEAIHLQFQISLLHRRRWSRPQIFNRLAIALHHGFFNLTVLLIWREHNTVLQAGGYNFQQFWQDAQRVFKILN